MQGNRGRAVASGILALAVLAAGLVGVAPRVALAAPPVVATASLLDGQVGVAYAETLTATDGTAPYAWSLASGALPAGLTLGAGGSISGTPTSAGTATFTVRVTDSATPAESGTRELTIEVAAAADALAVSTVSLAGAQPGATYTQQLVASGGTPPYTWTLAAGALPIGMSLAANGVFAGTPQNAGTSSFTVRVTDSEAETATQALTLTVAGAATTGVPTITTTTLPSGQVGVGYSAALLGTGGTAPYAWTIIAGALPQGVALDAASGVLSGTPTGVESAAFEVQLSDGAGAVSSRLFVVAVAAGVGPTVVTSTLPRARVGQPYTTTLVATDGTAPYTWTLAGGTLPTGLALDATTGAISGVPKTTGQADFVVTVTDAVGQAADASLSLAVDGTPPQILTSALASARDGSEYSEQLSASGGEAPYEWFVVDGALPNGLTLDETTGVIAGTASGLGTASFTVEVTDSAGQTAMRELTIVVEAGAGAILSGTVRLEGGFSLIVFGGGSVQRLIDATGCAEPTLAFWATAGGTFLIYLPSTAVVAVNEAFLDAFPGGTLPPSQPLLTRCR